MLFDEIDNKLTKIDILDYIFSSLERRKSREPTPAPKTILFSFAFELLVAKGGTVLEMDLLEMFG